MTYSTAPSVVAGVGRATTAFRFPGPRLEGIGLVAGPLLVLAAIALRYPFGDLFPGQLRAFEDQPDRMTWSYSLYSAGTVLLAPAIIAVARRVGATRPGWAAWGGSLMFFGLFARAFHAGVSHLAFQLVHTGGVRAATSTVAQTYGAFHIFKILTIALFAGPLVLAVGAFLARGFGTGLLAWLRYIGLAVSPLPIGVLKGSTDIGSLIAISGLCAAFVPLGLSTLRQTPRFPWWAVPLAGVAAPAALWIGLQG